MKSKKIYLVRHGQTDYNLNGVVQGSGIDSSLNNTGRKQAQDFFNHYKHVAFDKVYTSKLQRTVQSVQQFLDLGLPHKQLEGLNEISWGNREGVKITPEDDTYYRDVITRWSQGETNLAIEEGESPQEVYDRQKVAMDHILSHPEEENVLVCMHGRAIRILMCQLLNYPLSAMDMFEHHNLGLYLLNYTGTMFSVELSNNTDHLS